MGLNETTELLPCALVFITADKNGSPNHCGSDPLSYVKQSFCLNKSLQCAGFPKLNIFTNDVDAVCLGLSGLPLSERPLVHELNVATDVPADVSFYAAHFKLDVLAQAAEMLHVDQILLLLDTDIVALRELDCGMLGRCTRVGVGAFDISDQVFSAYGSQRVIHDLEIVAGRALANPRWYGGEFLLATRDFLGRLVPCARQCYQNYILELESLQHHGDEVFISAALNILADEGQAMIDVGNYQAIGRHWSGNTHRDLRWFQNCSLLHLSGAKTLLENESRLPGFDARHLWKQVSFAHRINRLRFLAKLYLGR
jgi:hypothetical protein